MSGRKKYLLWTAAGLAGALVLALALLLSFDWNRAKPWLSTRVSDAAGRPFAINGDLRLSWSHPAAPETGWRKLVPWPVLSAEQVELGNPPWATAAPYTARIRRVSFSVNPLLLLGRRIHVPELVLEQPDLVLQRAADGRNTWTFRRSGEPGRWALDIERLQMSEGRVRLVDAVKGADITAHVDSLAPARDDGYRVAWSLAGRFNRAEVSGTGKAGALLALRDDGKPYPLEADLRIGKSAMRVTGSFTRNNGVPHIDARLNLSGQNMADLYPIIGVTLPDTPPFSTSGHLRGAPGPGGGNWSYRDFKGKVGESDLSGSLHYRAQEPRPALTGELSSRLLRLEDLGPLVGSGGVKDQKVEAAPRKQTAQPADKALPVQGFRTERWTSIDADVKFTGHRILRNEALPIDNLSTSLRLKDGVLTLTPLNFGVAGGTLSSNVKLDGRDKRIHAELKLTARGLKLKQLFPAVEKMKASIGEVNGNAALTATGNSVAAMLGSANGEIKTLVNHGTISKLLLDQIGLNVGSIVIAKLFGDRQVEIHCMAGDFKVTDGLMDTRTFVVDTDDAILKVGGQINLANEQLNLVIYPESRRLRLISLRSPIYVQGSFKKPAIGVDKGVLAAKAGGAIALGTIAPVITALLPLTNVGQDQDSGCNRLLEQARAQPVAPAPKAR